MTSKLQSTNQPTEPLPEAHPEQPQAASPLETALANARAMEVQVAQATQALNEARIKLFKWQGAAEFQASLEHGDGPGNGKDTLEPLVPDADKEPKP